MVCRVGSTTLRYRLGAVEDLYAWLVEQGDGDPLGAVDELKPAQEGSVEGWGRDRDDRYPHWKDRYG
ncbi:DUF6855 family protein [Arthrobacter sp.]|uniref:DUF6855 family protein n=1 Tax=Arthrobacter sp. TaxID=1667 RepID=UPI0035C6E73A